MKSEQIKLTVLFDGTFWIGIFEKQNGNNLEVSKLLLGQNQKK